MIIKSTLWEVSIWVYETCSRICALDINHCKDQVCTGFELTSLFSAEVGLRCRFKTSCPLAGRESLGIVYCVGVFLRDPSPHLREFRRKPQKTPNGNVQTLPRYKPGTSYLPALSATTPPLVGLISFVYSDFRNTLLKMWLPLNFKTHKYNTWMKYKKYIFNKEVYITGSLQSAMLHFIFCSNN